jgi:hypothetical protein
MGFIYPKLSKQLWYREVDNVGAIVGKFIQHTKTLWQNLKIADSGGAIATLSTY